ncbi:MAG TPA: YebC/PmpR family DNA-binding transcriptional regulator [Caulobacteraceae bacterium]|nr:YebC/PmpR family DNA-binding transcriptional regulator [Caulobacteraceae bacterium]
MAGHSKFKNIQFRKDRQDKVRSKIFSKLSRDITVAARSGVPDPTANARLRLAIANARAESMPKDNIDRAIRKAAGGETDTYEEVRYEGFGPGGAAVIVEALTDNRNRAAASVRTIFSRHGGSLGESGSAAFMFERLGQVAYPVTAGSDEAVMEAAIEAGAVDVESDHEGHLVFASVETLPEVAEALEARLGSPRSTAIVWRPVTEARVTDEQAAALGRLIEGLEDDDDVQRVWTNVPLAEVETV